jgi:hypothetical protein
MQYAFGQGRKRRTQPEFDAKNPRAVAICDGCGFLIQHDHLREKKDYRGGTVPVGLGIYVCASCDDVPQPYYRRLLLRVDPIPVRNPRPDSQDAQTDAQEAAANAYSLYLNQLYGLA